MRIRKYRGGTQISLGYDRDVVIPISSDKSIIFGLDCEKGTFRHRHYKPEMTQGRISTQEIIDFLKEIETFTKPLFGSFMLAFFRWVFNHVLKLACLTAISFPLGIILGIIVHNRLFLITPGAFIFFIGFMLVFMIVNQIGSYFSFKRIERVKDQIIPYVQSKNSQFIGRGYHWVVPSQCPYWIELWKGEDGGRMEVVNIEAQYGISVGQGPEPTYSALNQHSPSYSPECCQKVNMKSDENNNN